MKFLATLVFATALLFASNSRADLIYQIDMDTGSLTGDGFIELSLGGLTDAPAALATVTSHSGAFGDVVDQFGAVTGDLSGTLQLASALGFADLVQQVSFGELLQLQVLFSGAWLDTMAEAGISFAIKLWSAEWLPLLTIDAAGDLLQLELLPGGSISVETFSTSVNVQPLISVPVPATGLLVLIGLLGLALNARARRSASQLQLADGRVAA
ncbi:MAG: NF038129 family PEP-CTERM protein [Permianibacter sp.]